MQRSTKLLLALGQITKESSSWLRPVTFMEASDEKQELEGLSQCYLHRSQLDINLQDKY